MPARIDPTTLYSREDLGELLEPMGIDPDGFIQRVNPSKRFRRAWWGADLIEAIDRAPCLRLGGNPEPAAPRKVAKSRRGATAPISLEEVAADSPLEGGSRLAHDPTQRRDNDHTQRNGGTVRNHPNQGPLGRG